MTDTPQFDFGEALRRLRKHTRVAQSQWKSSAWLELCGGVIYILQNAGAYRSEWLPMHSSILATDWVEVPDDATETVERC